MQVEKEDDSAYYLNRGYPAKRVIVRNDGGLYFNPDANKFVYFSRTKDHHCYYIFNKVLKIINNELEKARQNNPFITLPEEIRMYQYYNCVNLQVIRKVQRFFKDYLPPQHVELVTLKYLESFSRIYEICAVVNSKNKPTIGLPEMSDLPIHGGAYGMNSEWLELLNCCTQSTTKCNLSLDKFFNFFIETSPLAKYAMESTNELNEKYPYMLEMLQALTYTELKNPKFYSKNNLNDITSIVYSIEEGNLHAVGQKDTEDFFSSVRTILKEECTLAREG